jgi:hypothetical protein
LNQGFVAGCNADRVSEILITLLVLVTVLVGAIIIVGSWILHQTRDPYSAICIRYHTFELHENFTARTLAGFKVQYRLWLIGARTNVEEFKKAKMAEPKAQRALAEDFNKKVFESHLEANNYFFHLHLHSAESFPSDRLYEVFRTPLCHLVAENGQSPVAEVSNVTVTGALKDHSYEASGCRLELGDFHGSVFPAELIKENYAMLTKEEKEAVIQDEHYGRYEQALAIAALRRQLDFFGDETSREHKSDCFRIKSERSGRSIKLSWRLNPDAYAYTLLGFRSEGGFASDKWSESANGILIVDTIRDGEMTEVLKDGVAYYYTFFLKILDQYLEPTWKNAVRRFFLTEWAEMSYKKSVLRFQITVEDAREREALQTVLSRLEKRRLEPFKENLSRALKELGAFVEMDTAFEAMERSFIEQIEKSDYPEEVKREKIERLRDIVRSIRAKYEP